MLRDSYGLEFSLNCAADSSGIAVSDRGFELPELAMHKMGGAKLSSLPDFVAGLSLADALERTGCDILLETSPLNLDTGDPGLTNSRVALQQGIHLVLANKGPLALAHRELSEMAAAADVGMLYSATFCGGLPVLNIIRRDMVCGEVLGFRGIFNATTNFILQELQEGEDYADALRQAQAIGAAEADPSLDVEGWDTAAKLVIAANQFCKPMISLSDVDVTGIGNIDTQSIEQCRKDGMALKLIASAERSQGNWEFSVEPKAVPLDSFLGSCAGWEMAVEIESDIYGKTFYKLRESEPIPTAASVLRDAVHLAMEGRQASV